MKMYNRLGKNQKIIVEKIREQSINLKHCTDKKLHACIFCNPFEEQINKLCDSVYGATWIYVDYRFNKFGLMYPVSCKVMGYGGNRIIKEIQIL